MSLDLTERERSKLAQEVAAELDTGQYGDKYVISRRQLLTLATATGGGGVLAALGADGAAAQASDDTSTGAVRGTSGGGMDVYLDQLRDPTGDEVLNVDDTGAIDATLREWVFAAARAQSLGIENTGASLGEAGGDLVVKDSNGNVVLRYDSDTGSWVMDSLSTDDTDTKRLSDDYRYAGSYDRTDADARLDAAISDASDGQTIYLEATTYTNNLSVSDNIRIVGSNFRTGTTIESDITLSGQGLTIANCLLDPDGGSGENVELSNLYATLDNCRVFGDVVVSTDRGRLLDCMDANVTFEAGTTDGIVYGQRVNVTDSGDNTVGDIA